MKKKLIMLIAAIIAVTASAQTKRALLIGISNYPKCGAGSWGAIHGANDAELIEPILQKQGFKTTKICNEAATAKRIRKELDALVDSCKPSDTVYLHFSCHGQPFEDMDGDEIDGWDESIVPYDAQKVYIEGEYDGQNHITDDTLLKYFFKLRKNIGQNGFVCVVYDACYSGGSSRGGKVEFVRGTTRGFSPHGIDFTPPENKNRRFLIPKEQGLADITILEACSHKQKNYEIERSGDYYGPLSYCVNQVLENYDLTRSLDWVKAVKKLMEKECIKDSWTKKPKQNMVYETSLE